MTRFSIGDVVTPYWSPDNNTALFLYEVVRFDGSYVVCRPLADLSQTLSPKKEYHYLGSEIEVDRQLSRDNKLRMLCN